MSKQRTFDTILRKEERSDEQNEYSYELIMREGSSTASWRVPLYSIRVNMKDAFGVSRSADTKDIFADKNKAILFFEKIVRNLATPIDLAYIVEDEMCDI